jgi:putative membrane protein
VALAANAPGDAPAQAASGSQAQESKIDEKKFVTEAYAGGLAEIRLAKIAERRAQSPAVKQFAQKMQQDHSKADERLANLAKSLGIQLPNELTPEHQQLADRLNTIEADDFDEDYMKAMVDDHEKDVAAFKQASLTNEGAVAQFAKDTLPTLEQHLAMARQVDQQVSMGGPAGTKYDGEAD